MHTTHIKNTIFTYNSDYSGNVIIRLRNFTDEIEVPFEDLKEFVANWVKDQRLTDLEQMSVDELLLNHLNVKS